MNRALKQSLIAIPGVGVSLLPKLACPLCWPAYAGLLSSIGLGFLISTKYLLPLTAAFLILALGALALRARKRQGYGPFAIGVVASLLLVVSKLEWESDIVRRTWAAHRRTCMERLANPRQKRRNLLPMRDLAEHE